MVDTGPPGDSPGQRRRCENHAKVFVCPNYTDGAAYCDACAAIGWGSAPAPEARHEREAVADD